MDLEAYISRYRGETRLQRLLHIGKTTPDANLANQAYELAEQQMKEDGNALRYKEVFGNDNSSHPRARNGNIVYDHDFVVETEARNRVTRDMLSGRLNTAQSHLNKEAIRTAYLALAEADVLRGDLTEAYHAALRAKDYCTNRSQTAQVSFLVLELAIHLQNYSQVKDFCFKVQHTLLPAGNVTAASQQQQDSSASAQNSIPNIADKLLVAGALERLAHGDYAEAASKFRQVCDHVHRSALEWDTLIAPEDVATYAAITSLATASRQVLNNWVEHPESLEFVTPPLQDAMFQLASRANYSGAWHRLQELRSQLELDLFLAPHLAALFQKIRESCILEYWVPFQRVQLPKMAQDLNMPGNELKETVESLMRRGALNDCRMDCRTMCLVRDNYHKKDPTHETRRKMNKLGQQVLDDTYAMIIRLACMEHDLIVVDPQQRDRTNRGHRGNDQGIADFDDEENSSDGDTPMVDARPDHPAVIGEDDQANPEDLY